MVANPIVDDRPGRTVDPHQAGRIAAVRRLIGNPFRGKFVVVARQKIVGGRLRHAWFAGIAAAGRSS